MAEFVNPKYKDASRREFKAPTRLECMMQVGAFYLFFIFQAGFAFIHVCILFYCSIGMHNAVVRCLCMSYVF